MGNRLSHHGREVAIAAVAMAFGATLAATVPALAGGSYAGYVRAESQFGHGHVSGPVRHGRYGPQVRLPGGTWIDCRQSCSETLRVETVDLFEYMKGDTHDTSVFGRPLTFRFGY